MKYAYPIDYSWSTEEIIDVIKFYEGIEQAYEQGIAREQLMNLYRRFKQIVPSKAEERKLCDEFEKVSGYSPYKTMKKVKELSNGDIVNM